MAGYEPRPSVPFRLVRVRYCVSNVFKRTVRHGVNNACARACRPCWSHYFITPHSTKRDHFRMQTCNVLHACNVLRYSVLCASSHQRGRWKLPRTVRMSYRLNGLPAVTPPEEAGSLGGGPGPPPQRRWALLGGPDPPPQRVSCVLGGRVQHLRQRV